MPVLMWLVPYVAKQITVATGLGGSNDGRHTWSKQSSRREVYNKGIQPLPYNRDKVLDNLSYLCL